MNEEQKLETQKKSFEAFVKGERKNQIYYLIASLTGLAVACSLIWWSFTYGRSEATSAKSLVHAAIPMIASALSVTRIAACEERIAQYRAASLLRGSAITIALKLLERKILSKGAKA